MKLKSAILFFCLILFSSNSYALTRSGSIEQFRAEDSKRTYLFFLNEKQIGKLESESDGRTKFEGVSAWRFSEKLDLDFSPFGQDYVLQIENKHYVDDAGFYIGDDMKLSMNKQPQRLFLKIAKDSILGYIVRDKSKQPTGAFVGGRIFAADNNMIDHYEIFLAYRDINVGDTIIDTIFVPQALLKTPVKIAIENFKLVRYGRMYDSAYVCHFIEPTDQIAYFTRDKRIIRLDQKSQNIQILLSENPFDRLAPRKKQFTIADFVARIPLYFMYIIIGALISLPFIRRFYRKSEIYIITILGALLFLLLNLTLIPLQKWYSMKFMIPGMEAGGSIYFYAIFSALISGVIQEALKFLPILLIYLWRKPRQFFAVALGVFCGLGFAVYEAGSLTGAVYQAGTLKIVFWGVFERLFAMLFHMVSGAVLGYAISRGLKYIAIVWPGLMLIHSLTNYLIVFYQKGSIDLAVLETLIALFDLLLLLGTYLLIKRSGLPRLSKE